MKGPGNEVANARWFDDQKADWTMFEKLRRSLESVIGTIQRDKDDSFFVTPEQYAETVQDAIQLLEDLSIQENMRKRDFLCVATYEAIALMRERDAAVCVFTPHEMRGARVSRVEDRITEFGWEVIDDLALFPHTVACEHCNTEFESSEADYDDTLAGVAIICPNCAGYNLSKRA